MNAKNTIPLELSNKILVNDPSKILLELFPKLSHPSQSRFHEFFKKLKEKKINLFIKRIKKILWN